ncbi:MAG TPA: M23 family metallopeptidase [Chloroflexota bacterium]|nr:M23 family metallopeptidase [Chloroflexota bacterium]
MFEGMSEISARVTELQNALDPSTSTLNQSKQDSSISGATGQGSFAQTLQQAQAPFGQSPIPRATHAFSIGTDGASQMPGDLSASGAGGLSTLAGMGGLSGLSGAGGLPGALAGLGGDAGGGYGLLGGSAGLDPMGAGSTAGGLGAQDPSGGLGALVGQVAQQEGVNPALAEAVAKSESGLNPNAVSPAGAQGLMQVMPSTFKSYAGSSGAPAGVPVTANVSQPFGATDFANEPSFDWNGQHYAHFHTGVDFAAQQGTPIHTTMGGTVQVRSDPSGYGNLIVVRNGPWDVLYGHTSGRPGNIQTGSVVRPGDVVGFVGSTGNSTGPHVHYEIRQAGKVVDPTPFLRSQGSASPFDPVANAKAGVGYLKDMLSRFKNNVPAALAAYNAGPSAVQQYGGVPPYPETQAYVNKTMQYARDLGA